ncbi:cyclin-dependent kinase 11B isoform X1 [Tribolium castaneum]|uniref:cyclin-dependent kinase n=1 Tax=Tribolium castaneum TaxID=7070 RepID=D6X3B7_TRICA|nr:PREDICTED: cyclin-dependent kinase 11B isoform X1 [Tribolium castaneum]EFA10357.1 Serine/threonine-protein kinase PITSLRE-like Protein [Tribolium castaneum]|eukprot:XP_973679.2 PREDICTED: cyclin-dependent kinase 11B isoform X1 [Tribolium castaneum]
MSGGSINKENFEGTSGDQSPTNEDSSLRLMMATAERLAESTKRRHRDDNREHFRHERAEGYREKRHSHRDRHHRERRHRSIERDRSRHHRKKSHRNERDTKGNLLGSKYSDSCKYDVQKSKDFRNSNHDSENRKNETENTVEESKTFSEILEDDFKDLESESPPSEKRLKLEEDSDESTESKLSEEIIERPDEPDEKPEYDETLPPYYPAIEGCRSLDEFQCLNRIAEGTYGVVYRFRDKRTDDIVALKKLKMEKEKEGFPITSLREINTLLKGQHPNIVTVREIVVGSNMDKIFIVMDYVEHDLKSLIEMMRRKDQHFTPGEVKCLLKQLLAAVAHLHDNWILHRDLKTSNLLLSHNGILKVGDFGLAREYGSPLRPYTPIVVTLWYRAPELLLGVKEYSTPIDMWSVGCIFAEFLLMNAIFPGKSEAEQINRIFKCLGTPTEKIWPGFNKLPVAQKMKFTNHTVSNLRKRFQMLNDLGLSFMLNFLTFDPHQRITAEEALKHPYFSEFPPPIDPSNFPKWPAKSELGQKRAAEASPKPPSGGGEYKKLGDEDGFRIGLETDNSRIGAGFSLKF